MRAIDIHRELTLLGVCSEVHALVDDLALDFGRCPDWFIIHCKVQESYKTPLPKFKYVYKPCTTHYFVQGKLF